MRTARARGMYPLSPALGRRCIWQIGAFPMLDFRYDAGKVWHQGSQSIAGVTGSQIQQSMAATPASKNFLVTGVEKFSGHQKRVDDFSRCKERTSHAKDDG